MYLARAWYALPPPGGRDHRVHRGGVAAAVRFCARERQCFGGVHLPFAEDLGAHVRLLLALPLLVAAELIVHQRVQATVRQFIDRGIIAPADRAQFDAIMASVMRLRNSAAIEIALIVASIVFGYWVWRERMAMQVGSWYVTLDAAGGESLTVAGWWLPSSPQPFRFGSCLVISSCSSGTFPVRVSRLPLRRTPAPDRAGGLGFIGNSFFAFYRCWSRRPLF